MPIYHYGEAEKRASEHLMDQNLEEMVIDDPLLVLEIKKVSKATGDHQIYGSTGGGPHGGTGHDFYHRPSLGINEYGQFATQKRSIVV